MEGNLVYILGDEGRDKLESSRNWTADSLCSTEKSCLRGVALGKSKCLGGSDEDDGGELLEMLRARTPQKVERNKLAPSPFARPGKTSPELAARNRPLVHFNCKRLR